MLEYSKIKILLLTAYRTVENFFFEVKGSMAAKNGFIVLEEYLCDEHCDVLINEINQLPTGSVKSFDNDKRIFGSQHLSNVISKYFANRLDLIDFGELMVRRKLRFQTTLAGHISYKEGALGSGGGWHVDSHSVQFKAMIYLTDVSEDNGPFEVIPGSHKPKWFLVFLLRNWFSFTSITRFDNQLVSKYDTKKMMGKRGTVVLFNPLLIHRGLPVTKGERYALTNYYVNNKVPVGTAIDNLDKEQQLS